VARGGPDRPDGEDQAGGLTDEELSGLILDESFVRAAAVKEPPAAERDTASPIAAPPRPARLGLSPPPRTRAPFTWVRRRLATIIVVVLVAAMVAGSIGPFAARRPVDDSTDDGEEAASRPPASPFAGTPAADYADGAAGLVFPSAAAVEGFATAEVALALHSVRRALAASSLNESVISGASLLPYLDIVGPETRAAAEAASAGHGSETSLTYFVTRFPVEMADLVPARVKASGSFTYRSAGSDGLTIEGRHVFAYALVPAAARDAVHLAEVVIVRRDTEWRVRPGPEGLARPELLKADVATSGHCLVDDGGFVWPRFSSPPGPIRAGTTVPVQWSTTAALVPGTTCFGPVATRT